MEMFREFVPFIAGGFLPPAFLLALRGNWGSRSNFWATFLASLVIGFFTSLVMGELAFGLEYGVTRVLFDTALVFTGMNVGYHAIWQPLLGAAAQPASQKTLERTR